jgi:murein L,D-transpeptidase YafK
MSEERLVKAEAEGSKWASFWREELRPGYEAFEKTKVPPVIEVVVGRYQVSAAK